MHAIMKRYVEAAHAELQGEAITKAWKVANTNRGRYRMVGDKTPPNDPGLENYASAKTRRKQTRREMANIETGIRRTFGDTMYGLPGPTRSIRGEWQAVQRIRRGNLRRAGSYSPSK